MKKTCEGAIVNTNSSSNYKISQIKIEGKVLMIHTGNSKWLEWLLCKCYTTVIPLEKFLGNHNHNLFTVTHISAEEVLDIIYSLDASKSTGPSSIPLKLHLIADLIIVPILFQINTSFWTGKFHNALKIVIPIHKGSLDDVNNFRQISTLSIFDKIIEKLLHLRLWIPRD